MSTPPGSGGLIQPPVNAPAGQATPVGVQPGTQQAVVRARQVIISGPQGAITGLFVYAIGTTPAAGNQPIAAVTNQPDDPFGNPIPAPGFLAFGATAAQWANLDNAVLSFNAVAGQASQAGIASNAAGQLVLESGEVSAGDTQAEIGLLSADANGGTALIELLAAAIVQGNLNVTGTLTVNGSTSTGSGSNGGVTSGPSGTVSAFPAAGPNHTHAEAHTHPL